MSKSGGKYLRFNLVLGTGRNIPDPVSVWFTSLSVFVSLFRFRAVLLLSARLSAIVCIVLSKVVGKSCLSLSSRSHILLLW